MLGLSHAVATVTVSHSAPHITARAATTAGTAGGMPLLDRVVTRRVESMDASLRSAQRLLGTWMPYARAADGPGPALETLPVAPESPRLAPAPGVEGGALRARRVPGDPEPAFAGFLDGVQTSRIAGYWQGLPIVHGTVAAAIRVRRERRLETHGRPLVERSLYIPRALVPSALWDDAVGAGLAVVDTSEVGAFAGSGSSAPMGPEDMHPAALAERAVHVVESHRQRLERSLAEEWCRTPDGPLYIDGSLTGSERVATARCAVGVVKGHRTLYVAPDALPVIANLAAGERTTAFRLAPARRTPVLSWYVRLRDAAGRDPTWGLARIEIAETDQALVMVRADEVSRWVLAERAPLSLPDTRWHTMAYGVRDCEEFLRAIV